MVSKCPKCNSKKIAKMKSVFHQQWMFQDRQTKLMQGWDDGDKHYVCKACGNHFRNAWG